MKAPTIDRDIRQRAQRKGLSLRTLQGRPSASSGLYWLLMSGGTTVVAGGDRGLSRSELVAWLNSAD